MNKKRLVFDIETIGYDFDKLDKKSQQDLTKYARNTAMSKSELDMQLEEIKSSTALSPLTGEVIAIGVYDPDSEKGAVYFQSPDEKVDSFEENNIKYVVMDEAEMLNKFWALAEVTDEFISFFGRGFDVPFMMIRSAIHHIRPTKDLMSNRYGSYSKGATHYDLYDQLTFYGASRKKGGLHLWCQAFGIESPKIEGIEGSQVTEMFKNKQYLDIARYNGRDIIATSKLFQIWDRYIKF